MTVVAAIGDLSVQSDKCDTRIQLSGDATASVFNHPSAGRSRANPSFARLAKREFAAWAAAWAATANYHRARAEALKAFSIETARARDLRLTQLEAINNNQSHFALAVPSRWDNAVEAFHQRRRKALFDEHCVPTLHNELMIQLVAYDEALRALVGAPASTVAEVAHLLSRIAASEQEAQPSDLCPHGSLPALADGFRAQLRDPGGFEGVLRHVRLQLIALKPPTIMDTC